MRIRMTFSKSGMLVFTGTLDLQTIWERSIRRAGFQLDYSAGFHPQPRIQIANPLPLGYSGSQELVDIWLVDKVPIERFKFQLSSQLPEGLSLKECVCFNDDAPSIINRVIASEYQIQFYENSRSLKNIEERITNLMERTNIPRQRRGKSYDLRPLIHWLNIDPKVKGWPEIHMRLGSRPNATGRPDEVMLELGFGITDYSVNRSQLILTGETR